LENHKAPLVTFQVWYKEGSRYEAWGKTGLSHMLEHMIFKGTKNVGPGEFSRTIEQNGGDDNAFTSTDFTAYFEDLSTDRVTIPNAIGACANLSRGKAKGHLKPWKEAENESTC